MLPEFDYIGIWKPASPVIVGLSEANVDHILAQYGFAELVDSNKSELKMKQQWHAPTMVQTIFVKAGGVNKVLAQIETTMQDGSCPPHVVLHVRAPNTNT